MNPETFLEQYDAENQMEPNTQKLETQHYEWVEEQEIVRTPTFFINGYEMPAHYTINDLLALAPGLAAVWKKKQQPTKKSSKEFA